ncbi:hypothetical protein GYMLUDRAFT_41666 [Collybiopsis luxurians FD-317 M1]|uniref:Uncharacterized protein n=1 Tax=Collybiopsis luxurians FD-317 M1 TaxID=944289 RepID=A0A0D0D118_9AGAR|nr:hypothetical protein GYMLUDRAFT_41666 [Collybiopsis luxurians FD-317 M1]
MAHTAGRITDSEDEIKREYPSMHHVNICTRVEDSYEKVASRSHSVCYEFIHW